MKKIEFLELLKIVKESKLDTIKTKIICTDVEACPIGANNRCSFYMKTYRLFDLFEHFKCISRNKSHFFKVISLSKDRIYLPIKCVIDDHPCTLIIDANIYMQYQLNLFKKEK